MPEGDTIHGLARRLAPQWQGCQVERVRARDLRVENNLTGQTVARVAAWGKNLLIDFGDDTTLRVHLGINGSMRPVVRAPALSRQVALCVQVGGKVWMVRDAKVVERFLTRNLRRHPALRSLGPDLITDPELVDTVIELAVERSRKIEAETIAELLLSQRVAAGIGNVYRCEVLHIHRVSPFLSPPQVDDETLFALYASAARLLTKNVGRRRNTTGRPRPDAFVYGRASEPCLTCATPLSRLRLAGRLLFYCAPCQAVRLH